MPKKKTDYLFSDYIEGEDVEFLPLFALDEKVETGGENYPDIVPVLPLRNTVLFPNVVIPITVGREKSIKAVKYAQKHGNYIAVITQKNPDIEEPNASDLYKIGTLARIIKTLKLPDGNSTVIIQGRERISVKKIVDSEPIFKASYKFQTEKKPKKGPELDALFDSIRDLSGQIIQASPNIPDEAGIVLKNIDNPLYLVNFVSSNLNLPISKKQTLLEQDPFTGKAEKTLQYLQKELQMIELKNQIQSKVRIDIEKQQRDYFLNQQLKTIQDELGSNPQTAELETLRLKALEKKWPAKAKEAFEREFNKVNRMNPAVAEYSILLNYLELLLELPWEDYSEDNFDLVKAAKVLDRDHYGLKKIKERILEHLAVLKLKGDMKSPILCFVGPPGVGKTSLGKSIAEALNRSHVRMSLGGLHDESEVRGHRKTYVGAMPGRIIQSIKKSKSANPVFILDEIDKVGNDFRGDPSSALLEVLDPEQNNAFHDNYLEVEFDLSKAMFIATANDTFDIQPALYDRMEIIELSGYSREEKTQIAIKHLIPKQRRNHGLKASQVKIPKTTIEFVIANYTRESGVRSLDRKIASLMRRVAKFVVVEEDYEPKLTEEFAEKVLGKPTIDKSLFNEKFSPGVAIGLAWTSVGGEPLFIETSLMKGSSSGLVLTGNLGEVMKESASTALSYLKSNCKKFGLKVKDIEKTGIHIHVPEGATPKDGPSAGITIATALVSAFTDKRVKPKLAMTGEITLRGRVLPVGGIKEKVLAAKRFGMKELILCQENEKDVEEINKSYVKGMQFHFVKTVEEVLEIALE